MKRIIEYFRKNKWLFWLIFSVSILIPVWVLDYKDMSTNARYAVGVTTKSYTIKGLKKQTEYDFFVGARKIKGSQTEVLINARTNVVVPNGKYLVVYSTSNPKSSILLFDKPLIDTINIDSLNKLGVVQEDINWLDL
ncbi:MAG: hypothetical protein ACI9AT_001947 [Ulvibacter sp.]|jgi:hypothetical protein